MTNTARKLELGDRVRFNWSGYEYIVTLVTTGRALGARILADGTLNHRDQLAISLTESGTLDHKAVVYVAPETSPRYVVLDVDYGHAWLLDTITDEPVKTDDGEIYAAPMNEVRRTATTMNLADAATAPSEADQRWGAKAFRDANPLTPETAPDTRPEPARMDSPIEPDAMMSVEEQARLLNVPVESLRGDESKARHAARPEPERSESMKAFVSHSYEMGAYRSGVEYGEKYVRRALALVTDDMPYALHSALTSALVHLEAARETA